MPPKRKASNGGHERGSKKPKKVPDPGEEEVPWVLPKASQKNQTGPDETQATKYARSLYNRPWDELRTVQEPLQDAPLRTPIYRGRGKDLADPDPNRSSTALRRFFNEIKWGSFDVPTERYRFDSFRQHFNNGDENTAVVASRSGGDNVLALNGDYRLAVTINEQAAHLNIVRRLPFGEDVEEVPEVGTFGYFIELPPETSVTVNGRTYTHDNKPPSSPFFIGPLNSYAIIELLSQPTFFFRTAESLTYVLPKTRRPVATDEEVGRRDQNGDVAVENTTMTWTPLQPSPPASQNQGAEGETEITTGQSKEQDNGGGDGEDSMEDNDSEGEIEYSDAWTDEGETIEDSCNYMRRHLLEPQQVRYEALIPRMVAAINDRQPAGSGFSFHHNNQIFRSGRTMLAPLSIHEHHVLLAVRVGDKQRITLRILDPMAWRSTSTDREEFHRRARQMLIAGQWWRNAYDTREQMEYELPETIEWTPCAQHNANDQSPTYTVLNAWALALGLEPDPAFRPNDHGNESFFTRAQRLFDLALQDDLSWKLLLAFFRCSGFVKRGERENSKDEDHESDEIEQILPLQDRRFDQRKRPFQHLLEQQSKADTDAQASSSGENEGLTVDALELSLEDGVVHTATFASDHLQEADLNSIILPRVREGLWSLRDTLEQLKEHCNQRLGNKRVPSGTPPNSEATSNDSRTPPKSSSASSKGSPDPNNPPAPAETSAGTSPPKEPPDEAPKGDTSKIPEGFNPCEYFRAELQKLSEAGGTAHQSKTGAKDEEDEASRLRLTQSQVYNSVTAVLRAVNELQFPEEGFTLMGPAPEMKILTSASKYRLGFHDPVVLRYLQHNGHTILLLSQSEQDGNSQRAVVYVVDSAPGTFTFDQRQEVYGILFSLMEGDAMPETLSWVFGPQQIDAWQSEYFAILSAWTILLGLPLNLTNFHPGGSFFQDANMLVQTAENGKVDWKLIWAFLRCAGYVGSEEPPALDRRFTATVPVQDAVRHHNRLSKRSLPSPDEPRRNDLYQHFPHGSALPHTEPFEWDDFEQADSEVELPQTPDCEQFRQQLNKLLQDKRLESNLRDLRNTETVTREYGKWLDDTEVSLYIASVTLAITNLQAPDLGFGFVHPTNIQLCKYKPREGHEPPSILPTIRPGRPLMVPLHVEEHYFLLVIQLDENAEPTFSVLDSKAYHLDAEQRRHVHNWACRLLRLSNWWMEGVFPDDLQNHIPTHTSYIPVSQQPSDDECGYYTVLNAWTLALGLLPTPDACLDWSDQFFDDIQNVIHLARMGCADWGLIYHFLRCKGFVLEGQVPEDRKFTRTVELKNETYLDPVLEELRYQDAIHSSLNQRLDLQHLSNANRSALPIGRRHNAPGAFPSDHWGKMAHTFYANNLARNGRLNLSHNQNKLKQAHEALRDIRGQDFRNQLQEDGIDLEQQTRDQLLDVARKYIQKWHTGRDKLLRHRPCDTSRDTINFYRYLFKFFGESLQSEVFSRSCPGRHWKQPLSDEEVNLGIAAVVEAIDYMQSRNHPQGTIFAGGFSLVTSTNLQLALASFDGGGKASRPRRCFLMPLSVASGALLDRVNQWRIEEGKPVPPENPKEPRGHHLLAVIQQLQEGDEKYKAESVMFKIEFYDSSLEKFKDADIFLKRTVRDATQYLGWSTHRMEFDRKNFTPAEAEVPQQPGGGWQCGPHTVINAWILAMGLHPNSEAEYRNEIYEEFYTLARAACVGLLDWRTLVAWLFCRKLTIQRHLIQVPETRRFPTTRFWASEIDLEDRIRDIEDVDKKLRARTEEQVPYDFSNNVQKPPEIEVVVEKENKKEEIKENKNEEEEIEQIGDDGYSDGGFDDVGWPETSLNRSYDEPELDFLNCRRYRRHGKPGRVRHDALAFLGGYDGEKDGDGDVRMTDTPQDVARRRQQGPDQLAFLDGF